MADGATRTWNQALAYAVTGELRPDLGHQDEPDLDAVEAAVADRPTVLRPVPPGLLRGIGPAQFAAALAELRSRLTRSAGSRPVLAERPPDADERRLLLDVPPHH